MFLTTRWLLHLCLTISLIISRVSCELVESNYEDFVSTNDLIFCVDKITKKFFTDQKTVLIISSGDFTTEKILRRIQPEFSVNFVDKTSRNDFSTFYNYIAFDDYDDSEDPYEAVENMSLNPRGRYVIVTKKDEQVLEIAADKFWRAKITNVIFIKPLNDLTVKIFAYKISARGIQLHVIDEWKNGVSNGSDLFPNKFKNMENYPLRVTVANTRQMAPDIYVTEDNEELKINGLGSNLLNLFAERLNLKMIVYQHFYYGDKLDNGSWTGPQRQLIQGDADLSFAGILPTAIIIKDFEYSDFFRFDTLNFSMKMKGKTVSWQSMFMPLSSTVWTCYMIAFLSSLGVVCILKILRSQSIIKENVKYMNVLKVLLNQSVRYPKNTGIRLAFSLWLFYGYLVNICYTGSLVDFLSIPGDRKNPNTLEALEKSNIEIGGSVIVKRVLRYTEDDVERRLHDRFINLTFENFWEVLAEKDRAVVLYRTTALVHNWKNRMNGSMQVHMIKDPVLSIPLFYYMQKGHPFREPLNNFIRNIHSSGLLIKWMFDYDVVNSKEKKRARKSVVLSLHHLAGVFVILICGYFVSTVAFFFEIYVG